MLHETIELRDESEGAPGTGGFVPFLETYILGGEASRGAVAICPGGGYGFRSPREAEPIALRFNAAGYHAFVIHYSVEPARHPRPLHDASRALCAIRQRAAEWKVRPDRIALCGFSAGGHLAASLGVHWDAPSATPPPGFPRRSNRPDALVLCYPVISSGEFAHRGSFEKLLGPDASPELLREASVELHVSEGTPPAFLWHTFDDPSVPVENSLLFASALRVKGVPFELHVYPRGPHGLSLATAETESPGMGAHPHVATWMGLCIEWLGELWAETTV